MVFRQATLAEAALVENVIIMAARRIKAKGSEQWSHVLTGAEASILSERIKREEVYLYEKQNEVIGVFYLYTKPNEWDYALWGLPEDQDSYYLHRLSLADGYTGKGLAKQLLLDLQVILQKEGLNKKIRLDCVAHQTVLTNLYEASGFQLVGQRPSLVSGDLIADFNLLEWSGSI